MEVKVIRHAPQSPALMPTGGALVPPPSGQLAPASPPPENWWDRFVNFLRSLIGLPPVRRLPAASSQVARPQPASAPWEERRRVAQAAREAVLVEWENQVLANLLTLPIAQARACASDAMERRQMMSTLLQPLASTPAVGGTPSTPAQPAVSVDLSEMDAWNLVLRAAVNISSLPPADRPAALDQVKAQLAQRGLAPFRISDLLSRIEEELSRLR